MAAKKKTPKKIGQSNVSGNQARGVSSSSSGFGFTPGRGGAPTTYGNYYDNPTSKTGGIWTSYGEGKNQKYVAEQMAGLHGKQAQSKARTAANRKRKGAQ